MTVKDILQNTDQVYFIDGSPEYIYQSALVIAAGTQNSFVKSRFSPASGAGDLFLVSLEQLDGKIGLGFWKGFREISYGLTLPAVQIRFDLVNKNTSAPSMLDHHTGIPESLGWVFELRKQLKVMTPGQISNRLLEI